MISDGAFGKGLAERDPDRSQILAKRHFICKHERSLRQNSIRPSKYFDRGLEFQHLIAIEIFQCDHIFELGNQSIQRF